MDRLAVATWAVREDRYALVTGALLPRTLSDPWLRLRMTIHDGRSCQRDNHVWKGLRRVRRRSEDLQDAGRGCRALPAEVTGSRPECRDADRWRFPRERLR